MLSPKQAYELFLKKFPKSKAEKICEWDSFYSCSPVAPGDFSSECYKINKKTGVIEEWKQDDYHKFIYELPDDYEEKYYKISELT